LPSLLGQAADLFLRVRAGTILTTIGQIPDVFMECLPSRNNLIGHVEDVLELAVPCDEMLRFVEHRHAVAHVLERDAEFLLTLPDFIQQPRILHRDHRLGGEAFEERDLSLAEWPWSGAVNQKPADQFFVPCATQPRGMHAYQIREPETGAMASCRVSIIRHQILVAVMPPSITNSLPVTQTASSDAK
jgi:hypothetical protein